ncbi:nucleoside recognition domain-containing protein [Candidatus Magnetaquicoccus inordinatus]|uniref:nucleoside recognition domain-containing protein n=1 Tax=Candidatus Magnetaquicoccus inordinatus TaxID=2496818 RepID=UPI00102C3160|nr:nucleoside recognition domain-containing protein [Candidatus Magnetaquicoccus inordinatus]
MNYLFFALVLLGFLSTAWQQWHWLPQGDGLAPMQLLSKAMMDAASASVSLAIGLIGSMALFLGLMKVAERGGLLTILARLIRPLMVRLFPDVPAEHPAMGAMILNLAANALGLGNAATPFGIRAMHELNRLNPLPGTATNAMALFVALNTASITLVPSSVIAVRAALGSREPAAILSTTLFATLCATLVAVPAARLLQRWVTALPETKQSVASATTEPVPEQAAALLPEIDAGYPPWVSRLALLALLAFVPVTILYGKQFSVWVLPGLVIGFLGFGLWRGVRVYEVFVEGAKEGFETAVRIIPYLVAILVAVAMFRSSGAMNGLVMVLAPLTTPLGLPAEALPMALLRPFSGSGAYGLMTAIMQDPAIGPDSYIGMLVSTIQGSTETTFYVLAVYMGAVQVQRLRHTLAAALLADLAGLAAAVWICAFLFGER